MTVDSYLHIVCVIHSETKCNIVTIATTWTGTPYLHSRTYTDPCRLPASTEFRVSSEKPQAFTVRKPAKTVGAIQANY